VKKTLSLLALCLLSIVLFNSCKKSTTTPTPAAAGSMSFKVDGALATMDYTTAVGVAASSASPPSLFFQLSVIGSTTSNGTGYPSLLLTIRNPIIGINSQATMAYSTGSDIQNFYQATSGQVVITSITNANVVGTFQFVGSNTLGTPVTTKIITEGVFNCPVTQP